MSESATDLDAAVEELREQINTARRALQQITRAYADLNPGQLAVDELGEPTAPPMCWQVRKPPCKTSTGHS